MAYIGKEPTVGNFQKCDAISVVNGQAAYTLQVGGTNVVPESVNHMLVSLNGILQAPTDSFTVSGSTLTFASNLATGDVIDFVMILGNVLDLGVPSDNTVTTAKLGANAVTAAKLNNDIISGQTALATTPDDTDELLISDAGTIKRIDYSLLKSTPGLVHIQTTTISTGTASVEFTSGIGSTYDAYKFFISGVHPATDSVHFKMLLSTDGGSSYLSSYKFAVRALDSGNNAGTAGYLAAGSLELNHNRLGNADDESYSAEVTLFKPSASTFHQHIIFSSSYNRTNNQLDSVTGSGQPADSTAAINAVKFELESGNIDAGTFQLFGVSKS